MNFYGHSIVKKLKDYALNFGHGSNHTTQTETKKLSNDSYQWSCRARWCATWSTVLFWVSEAWFQNIYPISPVILKRDISYSVLFRDRTHNPVLRRIQMTVTVTWLRQLDKEAYNRSTDYEFVSLKINLLWSGLIRFKPDSVGLNWIQDHLEGSD